MMSKHMELLNLILDRRSCRAFQDAPLDRPTLAAIVEAGRYAPSAMNRQQCRFYVITDPKLLDAVTTGVRENLSGFEEKDCRYAAPALILVTNRKDNSCALQDAACAMENMMLAAYAMGVGLLDQPALPSAGQRGPAGPAFPHRCGRRGANLLRTGPGPACGGAALRAKGAHRQPGHLGGQAVGYVPERAKEQIIESWGTFLQI